MNSQNDRGTTKGSDTDPKEAQEIFRGFGGYVAHLLMASSLPEEQKQAWSALVPKMDLAQVDRLVSILEKSVAQAAWDGLGAERERFIAARKIYQEKMAALNEQTKKNLAGILAQVQAAEKS